MTPERWATVEKLYHAALEREAADRPRFLTEACAGDDALRREVDSLLAHDGSAAFLSTPAAVQAGHVMPNDGSFIGKAIGPYAIAARIGAGGMGEVYRARDQKLGRDVAIKILPAAFTSDPDRLARFGREARILAALNHPNIAAIYGLEESRSGGSSDPPITALVLELVDGETLAERLEHGPIPVREALAIARQIADALDASHEKGIIHRDLKPANIKITSDGVVKVLDFGLAKAASSDTTGPYVAQSPTITVAGTREGVILGTAAYMSPEQARGLAIDKRTDIWAFGCLLYEMLTGRAVFAGATMSDTIARVLEREADWTILPANVPSKVRRVLARCLEKDPKRRLRDIADVRFEIEDGATDVVAQVRAPVSDRNRWLTGTALFALGAATAWLVAISFRGAATVARHPSRLSIAAPVGAEVREGSAISPDGRHVVFVARAAGAEKLWLRSLDSLTSRELPGTETGTYPFWSPDSRFVAFFATGKLKRIDVQTGVVSVVCDVGLGRGGSWNEQGTILFNSVNDGPLLTVPAAGGPPTPLTTLDKSRQENSHRWPYFLPGGRRFLYFIRAEKADVTGVYLGSLDDSHEKIRVVNSASNAVFITASAGRPSSIAWAQNGNLMVQPFDVDRARVGGEPVALAQNVHFNSAGRNAELSVSSDGVLLYGMESAAEYRLNWFSRDGKTLATLGQPDVYETAAISPDESRVAVYRLSSGGGIAIVETSTGIATPLASGFWGAWSPDGQRIAFGSSPSGAPNVYTISIRGDGKPVRLTESPNSQRVLDWSPNGRFIVYAEQPNDVASATKSGIWVFSLADRKQSLFAPTAHRQAHAHFSPDGQWIAYTSTESGRGEIHVQSFPAGRGKWRVSLNGGDFPHWRRDGSELLYVAPDQMLMSTAVQRVGDLVQFGEPKSLFKLSFPAANPGSTQGNPYDVGSDGRILGFTTVRDSGAEGLVVLSNWDAELTSP